jgi:tetratricopeptide (TPR) repeat protein
MDPEFAVGHWALALAYEQKQMYAEAIAEHEKAVALSGASVLMRANLGRAYALAGRTADARKVLRGLVALSDSEPVSAYRIATLHASLGDAEATIEWLGRAAKARDHWMVWLKVDPMLEPVRDHKRFRGLLSAVGFPPGGDDAASFLKTPPTTARARRPARSKKAARKR